MFPISLPALEERGNVAKYGNALVEGSCIPHFVTAPLIHRSSSEVACLHADEWEMLKLLGDNQLKNQLKLA